MYERTPLAQHGWEPPHIREQRAAAERKEQTQKDTLSRLLQSVNDARETLLATRMRLFLDGYDEFGRPRQPTAEDPVDPMIDHAGLFAALAALREREQNRIERDELMARLDLVYLRAMARSNFNSAIRTVELQAKLTGLMPGRATKADARLLAEAEAEAAPAVLAPAPDAAPAPAAATDPAKEAVIEPSHHGDAAQSGTVAHGAETHAALNRPHAAAVADRSPPEAAADPLPASPSGGTPPPSNPVAPGLDRNAGTPPPASGAARPEAPPEPERPVLRKTWPHCRPPGR